MGPRGRCCAARSPGAGSGLRKRVYPFTGFPTCQSDLCTDHSAASEPQRPDQLRGRRSRDRIRPAHTTEGFARAVCIEPAPPILLPANSARDATAPYRAGKYLLARYGFGSTITIPERTSRTAFALDHRLSESALLDQLNSALQARGIRHKMPSKRQKQNQQRKLERQEERAATQAAKEAARQADEAAKQGNTVPGIMPLVAMAQAYTCHCYAGTVAQSGAPSGSSSAASSSAPPPSASKPSLQGDPSHLTLISISTLTLDA